MELFQSPFEFCKKLAHPKNRLTWWSKTNFIIFFSIFENYLMFSQMVRNHMTVATAYSKKAFSSLRTRGRPGKVPVGEINRSQTVCMVMVIEQSLGSWSHMWSLSNVSGCGSTPLFGSCAGTHQGKGSVSRFGR